MSSLLKIKPFKGLADGSEDPEEFLDDAQAAAEGWHMARPADAESSAALRTKMIRSFRQNLLDGYDAAWWWQMAVPAATKKNWNLIKKAFTEKFGQAGNVKEENDFAIAQAIMSLSQRDDQSIQAYVWEAEQMSKRIPIIKDPMLAVAVIRGLCDDTRRHEVSLAIRGKKTSFAEVIDLIKAAYCSIGDSDPFEVGKDRPRLTNTSPYYAMPPPPTPIMTATTAGIMAAQRSTSTDGIRPGHGREQQVSMTQKQFNEYLQRYMAEQGLSLPALQTPGFTDFRMNRHPVGPSQTAAYVTCYKCRQKGHYSGSYTNRPLSAEDQYQVRATVVAERRDWNRRCSESSPTGSFSVTGPGPSPQALPDRRRMEIKAPTPGSGPNVLLLAPCLNRPLASQVQLVRLPEAKRAVAACILLSDIPAVRSIPAAFLAGRTCEELEGSNSDGEECHRKQTKAISGNRPEGLAEPASDDSDPELLQLEQFLDKQLEGLAGMPDTELSESSPDEPAEARPPATNQPADDTVLPQTTEAPQHDRNLAAKKSTPISLMKRQAPYNITELPSGRVPNITVPQLLNCASVWRRELAILLRSSRPFTRKRKMTTGTPLVLHNSKVQITASGRITVKSIACINRYTSEIHDWMKY